MSQENSPSQDKAAPLYPALAASVVKASRDAGASKLPRGLYLVGTPIGHSGDMTLRALVTLASADLIACEDTRVSGALLARYGIKKPLVACHDHNEAARAPELVNRIQEGQSVALISDAGMPLVSDPGYRLARACIDAAVPVMVVPGPSASLSALALAGLPSDRFLFAGFLPNKSTARRKALEEVKAIDASLIFFESPQRLAESLVAMAEILGGRPAAVARELTKLFEETRRGTLPELATHYQAEGAPKGEIVIVVGPPLPETKPEGDVLDALLQAALRKNSVRDAVAAVAAATGLNKRELYARSLDLAGKNLPWNEE